MQLGRRVVDVGQQMYMDNWGTLHLLTYSMTLQEENVFM
jgi:hypothetical protein